MASLVPLAEQAGLTMVQMALAWVLRQRGVSSAIVGASSPDQLDAAVAASGVTLDDGLAAAIDAAVSAVVVDDPAHTANASPPARH